MALFLIATADPGGYYFSPTGPHMISPDNSNPARTSVDGYT
jgi:hypothetical protein